MRLTILLILIITTLQAKQKESYYQTKLCNSLGGIVEYRLDDGARVDCLTDDYAIESDFVYKVYESVGQSLYYGYKTKRKPAVHIIIKKDDDKRLKRLMYLANKLDIKVFIDYE